MSSIADESELPLITIEIASDLSQMHKPEDVILQETRQCGFSEEAIFAIKLTLEEAVTNSIKHVPKSLRYRPKWRGKRKAASGFLP